MLNDSSKWCVFENSNRSKEIFFNTVSMYGNRGIARISRQLFDFFDRELKRGQGGGKNIYFYPTVHFCQLPLPSNSVVLVHDLTPLVLREYFQTNDIEYWERIYIPALRQAKLILAISETTKTDLVNYLGIPDSKIRVVYNMVSRAISNKNLIPQDFDFCESDFVIYIGAADKHKNIQTLISAFALLDESIHLVILGGAATQLAELAKNQLRTRVHLIDNIDDSSYAFLLSKAAALVYPSLYEGFGLPVFEAAFARCPVVVSRRPAMTEFWTDNEVFYVNDPFDASEWANAISNVIDGPDLLKLNNAFEKASKYENMNVNQRILNILLSL